MSRRLLSESRVHDLNEEVVHRRPLSGRHHLTAKVFAESAWKPDLDAVALGLVASNVFGVLLWIFVYHFKKRFATAFAGIATSRQARMTAAESATRKSQSCATDQNAFAQLSSVLLWFAFISLRPGEKSEEKEECDEDDDQFKVRVASNGSWSAVGSSPKNEARPKKKERRRGDDDGESHSQDPQCSCSTIFFIPSSTVYRFTSGGFKSVTA